MLMILSLGKNNSNMTRIHNSPVSTTECFPSFAPLKSSTNSQYPQEWRVSVILHSLLHHAIATVCSIDIPIATFFDLHLHAHITTLISTCCGVRGHCRMLAKAGVAERKDS